MGGQDFIYSQRSGVAETLFKGDLLGVDADVVADLRARGESSRDLSFIRGAYHVPERFLERFATHVAKNLLVNDDDDDDDDDGTTREKNTTRRAVGLRAAGVPLILGIWGGKGCGKTFNVELCCRDMGITPFVVSAGELEDPVAGEPGAALRRAYVAAADEAARRGTPTVLVVNDLDAERREIQGRQGDGEQPDRAGEPDEPVRHPHRGRARRPQTRGPPRLGLARGARRRERRRRTRRHAKALRGA